MLKVLEVCFKLHKNIENVVGNSIDSIFQEMKINKVEEEKGNENALYLYNPYLFQLKMTNIYLENVNKTIKIFN